MISSDYVGRIEQQVIGTLTVFPEFRSEVFSILDPEHFVGDTARRAYALIQDGMKLVEDIARALAGKEKGKFPDFVEWIVDGQDHLAYMGLLDAARSLRAEAVRRNKVKAAGDLVRELSTPCPDDQKIEEAFTLLSQSPMDQMGQPPFLDLMNLLKQVLDGDHKRALNQIGIRELDDLADFSEPYTTLVIGAERAIGKSSLMRQMAIRYVLDGKKILYYALEFPPQELALGLICTHAEVPIGDVLRDQMSKEYMDQIQWSRTRFEELSGQISISSSVCPTVESIKQDIREIGKGVVVLIDHIGCVQKDGAKSLTQEISRISRGLREAVLENEAAMIVSVQLTKAPSSRDDRRPYMHDMRDSGLIAADATHCVMMWAPDGDDSLDERMMCLEKNRNGPTKAPFRVKFKRSRGCGFESF